MARVAGICGTCGEYYQGDVCEKNHKIECRSRTGQEFEGEGYYDHGLGCQISSRGQRKEAMKKLNVVEVGNEWRHIDPQRVNYLQHLREEKKWNNTMQEAHRYLNYRSQQRD